MTRAPLCVAVAVAGALLAACSQPVDFERMREQKRADPFGSSAFFQDEMSMRVPPAGTIAVSNAMAGAAVVPFPVTADVLARGRHDFDIYCAVCHGADGTGKSVMATNMPETPPPSLVSGEALELDAAAIFDIASHGRKRMPAYDWALPASERWAVVAYVRAMQGQAK